MGIYVYNNIPTPFSLEFSYTWSDQTYEVPYTWSYTIECFWAWSNNWAWWYTKGTFTLTAWDFLSIMVGQTWNSAPTNTTTYWFGWSGNQGAGRAWGGLSWVFTWNTTIQANDSARALVIWWWAGAGNGKGNGWMWWWETGQDWQWGSYGTTGWWWTQTWHGSWWNAWANQFNGWNGSRSYWQGWWGWWRWGNGSIGDSSWDDDRNGWGWSGYVKSTATNPTLTQWWWASATNDWKVTITFNW